MSDSHPVLLRISLESLENSFILNSAVTNGNALCRTCAKIRGGKSVQLLFWPVFNHSCLEKSTESVTLFFTS
ncbi:hypothetical protein B9Z55_026055 [Caenorhabditis nigoni]|uniref:Uncharacterized protein n=1 Tax=Caenorhabditis nigoni TaxID=1611254 RepID=A0A2G5T112_9PELO|nr:hypothetical protein B9Z55_026055 [Caenorhabditis nigoni]